MKIKVEQSGGLAGLSCSNEMDFDKLPPSIEGTIRELLSRRNLQPTRGLARRKGGADYLNYKIFIQDGKEDHVIECNELDMDNNVKTLVGYFRKNSRKTI